MATRLQRRRNTTGALDSFVGAEAETVIDTTKRTYRVCDGETPGGAPASETVVLSSIKELGQLPPGFLRTDRQYSVASFWSGSNLGGGTHVWNPSRPKADHNGGTVIDPDKLSELGAVTDADPFGAYFTANTEGVGCFELLASKFEDFEMFGAVEGGTVDNTLPWSGYIKSDHKGLDLGAGEYLIAGDMPEKSGMMLKGAGSRKTKIISDLPNQYVFQNPENERKYGIILVGLTIQGDPIPGSTDTANVARGVGVSGWENFYFDDVVFDTFNLTGCMVSRLQGDWIQAGEYNSKASVDSLLALNSKYGFFHNCRYRNIIASSGTSIFGGSKIYSSHSRFENTGATNVLVDDASQSTPLVSYCVNDDIHFYRCEGDGVFRLDGCAKGSAELCNFDTISTRSYDFDQQLINVPESPEYNGKPFLSLNYLDRGIFLRGNIANKMDVRSAPSFVKVNGNAISSKSDDSNLLVLGNNGVSWPDGNTYWDSVEETVRDNNILDATGNTYICKNLLVTAVTFYAPQPMTIVDAGGSIMSENGIAFSKKVNPPNQNGWSYSYESLEVSTRDKVLQGKRALSFIDGVNTRIQICDYSSLSSGIFHNYDKKNEQTQQANQYSFSLDFNGGQAETRFGVSGAVGEQPSSRFAVGRTYFGPTADNVYSAGRASLRYSVVYAGTGTINTSDEREKQSIQDPETAALRAWGKVNFKQYKFNNSVELKGGDARWHFGVIAQDVKEAFESEGLDPFEYGVLCYDEWEDEYEYEDYDEDGNGLGDPILVTESGNRYGIRYDEALALECAYIRARLDGQL